MKKYMSRNIFWLFGWLLLAGAAGLTGCQTTDQADSGDMASVEISSHTEAEIQQATAKVFLSNGYQQADRLTFEKQGTGWDKAAYGGWSPNPVWIKMRANITSMDADKYILGCNAYLVTDRNEATLEEEKKLSVSHRSECKKILDQIKTGLDSPPAVGTK
jgi:hypothetical protein